MATKHENKVVGSGPAKAARGRAAEEYWTPERIAAAKPKPLPKVHKGEGQAAEVKPEGEQGSVAPGYPEDKGESTPQEVEPRGRGGNPVAHPLVWPYTTCGKLFFTQADTPFTASASVVARNVLLTAGHCVFEGEWSQNVMFRPSFPDRVSTDPAYQFSWSYEAAWTGWTQHSNRAFDYGFIWIDNNPGDHLGWLGMMWNASTKGRTWDAVGYPGTPSPPFNASEMIEAIGTVASSATAGTIGLTNDNMEHGSSGGPWITDLNGSPREYANGLQSFHITDGSFTEFGPYFTADLKSLFDWISNPANRH
jgi:V8-like Glu-specific endopeptidase